MLYNSIIANSPFILLSLALFLLIIFLLPKVRLDLTQIRTLWYKMNDHFFPASSPYAEYMSKLFRESNTHSNLYKMHAIQCSLLIGTFFVMHLIYITDFNYKTEQLLGLGYEASISEDVARRVEYFEFISEKVLDYKDLQRMDQSLGASTILTALLDNFELSYSSAVKIAGEIYTVMLKQSQISKGASYYLLPLIFLFIPDIFLLLKRKLLYIKYINDLQVLKISTLILANMHVKTLPILAHLRYQSPVYYDALTRCILRFSGVSRGPIQAIQLLSQDIPYLQFRKLCNTFRELLSSDKASAVLNLRADMELEQKEREARERTNLKTFNLIAFSCIMPSLYCLISIIAMPLLQYISTTLSSI